MYEATLKNGRSLHERAQTSHDRQHLENLLAELKDTWDTISGKSMERYETILHAFKFAFKFLQSISTFLIVENVPNILVCFCQTAQAGGSTAVLR